jgi:hypothetical protein
LLGAIALINFSPVQTMIAQKAAGILSGKLKTEVSVAGVRIGLLNRVMLQGVYIGDQAKDTILYAGEVQVKITDWFIFKDKPVIHYVGLKNTFVYLNRKHDTKDWNYDFLVDALSSPSSNQSSNSQPIDIDLKKIELTNVRFHMDDAWIGEDMDYDFGYMLVSADKVDLLKRAIVIDEIAFRNVGIVINEYKGGRPDSLRPKHIDTFDTTPFNPDMWTVTVEKFTLHSSAFKMTSDDRVPEPGHFDESHMDIKDINIDLSNISIVGDTIVGDLHDLTAVDRSGIAIKKMSSRVTVSPVASICEDLYMETNNSILRDYYAMHYKHFPDFNDYIDKVEMVAHLKDAQVDRRDVMYFAPELEVLPEMLLKISGDGRGTVRDLKVKKLNASDGNIALKGNLSMKGLPYIYNTYIDFSDGEILATGKGITHYAPDLKGNPNVNVDSISFAYFNGTYKGFLENFRVSGTLKSNMGSVAADLRMYLPGFLIDSSKYAGTITSDKFQLGRLLRQSFIGDISLNEKVTGNSFNPDNIHLDLEGTISEFTVNNYQLHNIITEGVLARKQFDGRLIVDDPNLALDFNGSVNYQEKELRINATAHLLGCDFKALNLTPENITATSDFDLNWKGSNIDNFSGYAKLFNLDLKRNNRKLDIDSVFVRSSGNAGNRLIDISSDALTATISGKYELSNLPASIQYYLSRYIPNYIKAPEKYAPDQDLSFMIFTANVDSIFAVTFPMISGFDSSLITGSLNTNAKKLMLNANIPYGSIGNVHLKNVTIEGDGDFSVIALNTTVGNIAIGDSLLNGELSLTTAVGNDTVTFTLATISPDKESSLSLNGRVVAFSDSLQLTVFPSRFFMNKAQWNIDGGSNITYSEKYLSVDNLSFSSGLQRVSVNTSAAENGKITLRAENIDVSQLGNIQALSSYQPDGRIDGTISVADIFNNLQASVNVLATNIKLNADTVGTIRVVGGYDGAKHTISINPQTGIFRGKSSVVASGKIDMDAEKGSKLDGSVKFYDARIAWAQPFLTGVLSNLSGSVNGSVDIWGSDNKPVIDGKLSVTDAAFRLDYMGCNYTIPHGVVGITNTRIALEQIVVFDAYKNRAILSGHFSHDLFDRMRMRLKITTPKFEVMNLSRKDNDLFYGKLIASMDSFTIRGPFNNIRLNLYNGEPAEKSTIFIPASSGGYVGAYNYVSFKTYGKDQEVVVKKRKDKISLNLDANLNTLAEIHIILDPATDDEIVATGTGNIQMDIPPDNDMRMSGLYTIYNGVYTLTFQQLAIHRQFRLNSGSTIAFNGPFAETNLNVDAVYSVQARLYDVLTDNEKNTIRDNKSELTDAQTPQWVNVYLHMKGPIYNSRLTFDIDLDNKHSQGSVAYSKLQLINNDDRQKFDQVASLLLVGSFIPSEGAFGATAVSGAINNVSQIISSTASTGLTSIVNKIIGDRKLNVAVKYTNYNYNDQSTVGSVNRSQLRLGVTKNYLNDRLLVSIGSTSDWGKPATTTSTSSFNIAGDFRLQYLLSENSGLRLNAFQTSDYDLTVDRNIQRRGVGIGWRKSFDNLGDFFRGNKYARKQKEIKFNERLKIPDTTASPAVGD